ncbi:complement factor H-related protein 4 [Phodopus roborovskii]|uniref:complement factor H-related protein 4 n=1 Tax=Phodopus roborovskii TaxID=109678 RepID=UPI0021E478E0|nr:complement factor H-related protein 4 [Phodopus roborovskii]
MLLLANVFLSLWLSTAKGEVKPCDFPHIKNGGLYHEGKYRAYFPASVGKQFSYYCKRGFVIHSGTHWGYIRCTTQGWEPAVPCLRQCSFPYVDHGVLLERKASYVQDQSAKVKCYSGYRLPNGQDTITCTENGWSPQPKCIRVKTCLKSDIEIENGSLSESDLTYALNKTTQYRCKEGYVTPNGETSGTITCLQSGWSSQPSCIKSCDRPVFENAGTENNRTWFKLNDKLDYECHVGYESIHKDTKGSITCNYDGWSDIPSCYDSTKTCGPPPPIDNGDITSFPLPVYAPLSSVEYQCQSLYRLQGNKKITCRNGEWSEKPKCLHPCIVSEGILETHNIIFRWREKQKRYYESGEMQEFRCKNGYHLAASQTLNPVCNDGHIVYPTCTKSH